ncbi:MAG: oligosaccharide flippase family protein [Alphaproteobacteria bacterium]|nr:oligosaccharide flippase family protein [Alphaproteobacteria bacterium]
MTVPESGNDHHLETAHLQGDLVGRSVRGGAVTLVAQGMKVVLQFGAIVILARLLTPGDFGLFAMVAAFLVVLELLKDLGLSTATVQRADITHAQVSTLFWLNCGLGVAVAAVTAALAPVFAWFFGEPELLYLTPVVALAFLFTGLAAQHLALLRRQMRFGAVAAVQLGSEAAGLTAAVIAALYGLGFWSLVIQRIAWAVVMAAAGWVVCGWRPSAPGPLRDVRRLVAFGGNTTGAMVIGALSGNLDKVLIGWTWGVASLGLFERAQKILQQPIQNLNTPLATVALPALSRLVDRPESYRGFYTGMVQRLTMLMAPVTALSVAAAGPVVEVLLGQQWMGAAPILAWMGVAIVWLPLTYSLSWLYMSQDRAPEMLRASLISSAIGIVAIVAGVPFGATGVAVSFAASLILVKCPILFWLVGRRGPVAMRDFYRILAAPIIATVAAAGAIWAVRGFTAVDTLPPAAALACFGVLACVVALLVYGGNPDCRRMLGGLLRVSDCFGGKTART